MHSTKLTPVDFAGFIERSVVCAELLTLSVREINRDSDTVMDSELLDMSFQLCIETLVKHNLTTRQLFNIDVLDFVSTTSSEPVRHYFTVNPVKGDELKEMMFKFDVKFVKTAMCLVMTRMIHGKKRDMAQEIQNEYRELTS